MRSRNEERASHLDPTPPCGHLFLIILKEKCLTLIREKKTIKAKSIPSKTGKKKEKEKKRYIGRVKHLLGFVFLFFIFSFMFLHSRSMSISVNILIILMTFYIYNSLRNIHLLRYISNYNFRSQHIIINTNI